MERVLSTLSARPAGRPGVVARLLRMIAMGRSRHRLAELDSHLLRDLGLTREEARREAERPTWDAPSHWLR